MRFKKFLLIPLILILLILAYDKMINSLANTIAGVGESPNVSESSNGQIIGVGQAVSIQIIRATKPYLFGLIHLPNYAQGIGNLETVHTIFFSFLIFLTVILIIIFIIIERRTAKMEKFGIKKEGPKRNIWLRIGKSLGIGILFALIAYILSGDPSSLVIGLLIAYLEFRLF
jgi:hypothetical protein